METDLNTIRAILKAIIVLGLIIILFMLPIRKFRNNGIEFIIIIIKNTFTNFHRKDFDPTLKDFFFYVVVFLLSLLIGNILVNYVVSLDKNIITEVLLLSLSFIGISIQIILKIWNSLMGLLLLPFGVFTNFETANYFNIIIFVIILFFRYLTLFLFNRITEVQIKTVFKNFLKISLSIFILALVSSTIMDVYKYIAISFKSHYQFFGFEDLKYLKNNSFDLIFGINKNAEYELIKKLDIAQFSIILVIRDLIATSIIIIGMLYNNRTIRKIVDYTIIFLICQSMLGILIVNINNINDLTEYNKLKTYHIIIYISLFIFIEFFSSIEVTFEKIDNLINNTNFKRLKEVVEAIKTLGFKEFIIEFYQSGLSRCTIYAILTPLIILITNKISGSKDNNEVLFWIILSTFTLVINLEIKSISKYKKITSKKFTIIMIMCIFTSLSSLIIYSYTNETLFKTTISFSIAAITLLNILKIKKLELTAPELIIYTKYVKNKNNTKKTINDLLLLLENEIEITKTFRKKIKTHINNLLKIDYNNTKDSDLTSKINLLKKNNS